MYSEPTFLSVSVKTISQILHFADMCYARADEKIKRKALMEAYNSPASDELPIWKKDKGLLDWLKSL